MVFKPGYQRELIECLKSEQKASWVNLAEEIGISEHTLRVDWRGEKSTLPLAYVKKIVSMLYVNWNDVMNNVAEMLPKNWGQKQGKRGIGLKKISIPLINDPRLAEFLGILLGDGYLTEYIVEICGDAKFDRHYLAQYVQKLVFDLFGLIGSIRTQHNVVRLRFCSKMMSGWIAKTFGLSYGKKIDFLTRIPKMFLADASKLSACIRGCVDTDGGIYRFHNRAGVAFFNKNRMLLEDVAYGLKQFGFSPYFTKGKEVWLLKKRDVLLYLSQIGTSNMKNVVRILEWQNKGRFPPLSEVSGSICKNINVELPYTISGPVV